LLELVQLNYMNIQVEEGRNNFILEWNEEQHEGAAAVTDSTIH